MKVAAIDIGSNSIHLAIMRAVRGQHLEIIDREKEMVRLGSVTLREHRLAPEAIDRAITTLARFKMMAEANKVDLILTTATAAVRESHNADEFINRVRLEVGLDVQLLPGIGLAQKVNQKFPIVTVEKDFLFESAFNQKLNQKGQFAQRRARTQP